MKGFPTPPPTVEISNPNTTKLKVSSKIKYYKVRTKINEMVAGVAPTVMFERLCRI
jgi:hypothetical protein